MRSRPAAVAASAIFLAVSAAHADAPGVHALTGARVVVAPGRVLPSATVVLRDGVIVAVGARIEAPPDARLWPLDGKTVYPGLIDAWVPREWPLEKAEELPQSSHPNPVVRAERSVLDRPRDEKAWKALRQAGFTSALVVPGTGLFRGRGAIANLGDDPAAAVVRPFAVQAVAVGPIEGADGYPSSLMGAVALFRQTLLDARWHRQAQAAYAANPAQTRPRYDASLAALEPVAHGEMPVAFETRNVLDTLRVIGLAGEMGLRSWVVGSGEEYRRIDELRARPLPLILPIDFPDRPEIGDSDDRTVGLDELRHWDEAPANPARLVEARVPFALTSFRQKKPKELWEHLARAIDRGLSAENALAALTQVPAEFLGISGRAGTIESGKMANLVIVDGDLFVAKPKIEAVWIDGVHFALDAEEDRANREAKPSGGDLR